VFGIARRGAGVVPDQPANELAETRALLDLFDCECLLCHAAYAPTVEQLDVRMKVCLDLMQHPAVRDCAVVGLPDDKWGERVTAVIESSAHVQPDELVAFVKARIGSVKAPKQVGLWRELPRSRVGKVLKADVQTRLLRDQGPRTP